MCFSLCNIAPCFQRWGKFLILWCVQFSLEWWCLEAGKLIIRILKLKLVRPRQLSVLQLQSATESTCWFSAVHACAMNTYVRVRTYTVCMVCGTQLKYFDNTINLRKHLGEKQWPVADASKRTIKQAVAQLQLNPERAKRITKSIASFIALDLRPYSVVENMGFQTMVFTLEPRYKIPSWRDFTDTATLTLYRETKGRNTPAQPLDAWSIWRVSDEVGNKYVWCVVQLRWKLSEPRRSCLLRLNMWSLRRRAVGWAIGFSDWLCANESAQCVGGLEYCVCTATHSIPSFPIFMLCSPGKRLVVTSVQDELICVRLVMPRCVFSSCFYLK